MECGGFVCFAPADGAARFKDLTSALRAERREDACEVFIIQDQQGRLESRAHFCPAFLSSASLKPYVKMFGQTLKFTAVDFFDCRIKY